MPGLAGRLALAPPAATIAMTARAREMRAAGAEVISLTLGEPDFPTPPHAIAAAHAAALRGETRYPPVDGTPALKQAVQRKFRRDAGLDYALDEIMVAHGGKQVIYDALLATLDPGDEVIVPAPYWATYPLVARFAGGTPVFVGCEEADGFRLRPAALEAAITPRSKWLILNYPNNPTGAGCSRDELGALAQVLLRHEQLWVLSDDIYEHLVYDAPAPHPTLAAVEPRLRPRVLTVSGVSKTYAMTGWRVGFCGGPRPLLGAMANIQGQATSGVSAMAQAAAAAALDGDQTEVARQAAIYRRRRDLVVERLGAVPGMTCHRPEGAFYVYPGIAGCLGRRTPEGRLIDSDEAFALALLETQHVAVVHGAAFGMSPYLRISYATADAVLEEACRRIRAFCAALR